jgi:hypothetical protein
MREFLNFIFRRGYNVYYAEKLSKCCRLTGVSELLLLYFLPTYRTFEYLISGYR